MRGALRNAVFGRAAAPSGPPEVPFANVVGLYHFDGANAGLVFTDSSSRGNHITSPSNSLELQTLAGGGVAPKFGTANLHGFGGTSAPLPVNADWSFGTGDFSVEAWVRSGTTGALLSFCPRSNSPPYGVCFYMALATGNLALVENWGANTRYFDGGTDAGAGNYNFVTFNRVAGAWVITMNGVLLTAGVATGNGVPASISLTNTTGRLGNYWNDPTVANLLTGYIDELRITKGAAQWTGAHAVPTAPFPDS